jgi:DNA-binding NarL/FixJ family response regulator
MNTALKVLLQKREGDREDMEIQIASMIKLGKSNKDISTILNRSIHTIANHRESMRRKLGLKNQKINLRSYLSNL